MKLLYKIIFLLSVSFSFGQSSTCENAAAMCSGNQGPFNNTTGVPSFGSLGCLGSTPNPAWFYMQVGTSGNMDFTLFQTSNASGNGIDVDFILWGPFNSLSGICNNLALYSPGYTGANNVIDCSYSASATEQVNITGAVSGQYYMLLVTNFSGQAGTYSLNQTGGTGTLSCDIVCGVNLGPDRILCGAATDVTLTASFLQAPSLPGSPVYSWYLGGVFQYTTPTNTTTVNQNGTWSVSVTRPGCSDVATDDVLVNIIGAVPFNNTGPIVATPGECNPVIDLTSYEVAWVTPYDPASFTFVYYDENANVITDPTTFSPTATTFIGVQVVAGPCDILELVDVIVDCVPSTCTIDLTSPVGSDSQVLCAGLAISNITYDTTGTVTDVTATGLPTGLSTNFAGNTFTISGTPTQTGTYNYTLTTVGCTPVATATGTITIIEVPNTPTINSIAPTCTLEGSSEVSNYDFAVNYIFTPTGPVVNSGGFITGMVTGTSYTLVASNGTCSSASSVTFSNDPVGASITIPNIVVTPPTCTLNGFATILNYDGALSYVFTPVGPIVDATGLISGMTLGTSYVVLASDGVCFSLDSSPFAIDGILPIPLIPTISLTPPTCSSDGLSAVANYDPGVVYDFTPSGPIVGMDGSISNMTVGISYTVIANNGTCVSSDSVSFMNNPVLLIPNQPLISITASTCSSNEVATISNYDASMSYTFTPTGPTVGVGGIISGMTVGTSYSVTASNASCTSLSSASFSINAMLVTPPVPTITSLAPTCVVDGSSSISNYDGSLTYTFSPVGPAVGLGGAITGMITGTNYTVVASNTSCTSASSLTFNNAAQLSIPVTPIISISASTCSTDGVATITNYVPGLIYVFSPSGPSVNAAGVVSGMTVGTNYVVAASNGSCASTDSASFNINAMLIAPATPTLSTVAPTCTANGSSSISNYNATLTYTFTPSGPTIDAAGTIIGMTTGTSYTVVSNDGTCSSATSALFVNVAQLSSPVAPSLSVVNPLVCSGERAIFQIDGTPNNIVTFSINGGSNQTITLNSSGLGIVEFVTSNVTVEIELSNINNGDCSLALSNMATVNVQFCSIPKGISPNGDGLNDSWDLSNYDISKVEIFNRYGTKVYSKSNYQNEWFGLSDSGKELPDGTYYFVIDFTDLETQTGWIYINRERK
ncbi:T9SS type B sorting domain-containing protein [Flavobacterium sp. LMO8]|uniref:T9SS type B sorting domain-containing protein n=1 Tax=Flavobacterium sp. LMO8 TaxID=2654244 RepID=UPI001291457A|nr:gliding motility-associated C-terminal domain-containing protein [Flavobacterium sp. LMO8]MQP24023.1 T9SS type B sorting domain-containing protein [Flavobacterium sp. LMO8]